MLRDAIIRVAHASESVGVRVLLVHAEDDAAAEWDRRRAEFLVSPLDARTLMLPLRDIASAMATVES